MTSERKFGDVTVSEQGAVALVVFSRPPDNYFDMELLRDIGDALEAVEAQSSLRAIVLASEGRSFCAGAKFGSSQVPIRHVYEQGLRIFACRKPIVAAIQGGAIGGGLGLALTADFRVVSSRSRLSANFVKIGIHPGFAMTRTLPRLVGEQKAALLMLTGRRLTGEEAVAIGLADELATDESVREQALALAGEIAEGAPLAVQSTRATLRMELLEQVSPRLDLEIAEQLRLFATSDFEEGVRAVSERRVGNWTAS